LDVSAEGKVVLSIDGRQRGTFEDWKHPSARPLIIPRLLSEEVVNFELQFCNFFSTYIYKGMCIICNLTVNQTVNKFFHIEIEVALYFFPNPSLDDGIIGIKIILHGEEFF
jgi:hypothetical protein